MLERLKLYREHIAAAVTIIVAVNLIIRVVNEVLSARSGTLVRAMRDSAGLSLGLVSVLCLILTAGACILIEPTTKHARLIAIVDAILVTVGSVVALVNLIGVVTGPEATLASILEGIGGGTDIALKIVAAVVLWMLARRVPTPEPKPAVVAEPAAAELEPTASGPTWSRDAAAGVSWQSARQAAQGTGQTQWRSGAQGGTEMWRAGAPARGERPPAPVQGDPAPAQQQAGPAQPIQPDGVQGPAARADRSLWNPPGH